MSPGHYETPYGKVYNYRRAFNHYEYTLNDVVIASLTCHKNGKDAVWVLAHGRNPGALGQPEASHANKHAIWTTPDRSSFDSIQDEGFAQLVDLIHAAHCKTGGVQ